MLRHDYVSHDQKLMPDPQFFKDFTEEIPRRSSAKKRQAMVATESDKMQMAKAIGAPKIPTHTCRKRF